MRRPISRIAITSVALLATLSLAGCTTSTNASSCETFESGYNQLADAVRTGAGADAINVAAINVASQTDAAFESADGDVRERLGEASTASSALQQEGVEPIHFFESAEAVAAACAASGASINLHSLVAS
jgi:hypothetical protein